MAAGDVKNAYAAKATVTVTLASLANGSARESTVVSNTLTFTAGVTAD